MSNKDLFDDTTMTFGEHLEVLRSHLWRAIVGLVICTIAAFFFSDRIIVAIQTPVIESLDKHFSGKKVKESDKGVWESAKSWWTNLRKSKTERAADIENMRKESADPRLVFQIDAHEVAAQLHELDPQAFPSPPEKTEDSPATTIQVHLTDSPLGKLLMDMQRESMLPRTDGVDEAFMIYLKVSLAIGVLFSSPWIFYQIWLFVGAGLYSHERKYVYTYLPLSILLFLGGAAFCYFGVIPLVLDFLFTYNTDLQIRPEIKISTWITFALMVSLMFGVSFQLPLVMLFLDRISLVKASIYREKRRHAILVIAFLSMVLTPSDPVSMMMMMVPLCILYELGILMCGRKPHDPSPFEALPA